jgi:hypothetical protein
MTDLSFGWPLLRRPLMWTSIAWLISMVALGAAMAVLILVPDKWDRATLLRVCRDGTLIVRLEDGKVVAKRSFRAFRIEGNWEDICR